MPAYRSAAEAEIREAAVARLRETRPDSRIIHEVNVSTYGPNRIDLIAVGKAEIIAVEVKSAKDKLDRLAAQVASMRGMAHTVIAAVHERFMVEHVTNAYAAHSERDGVYYRRDLPDDLPRADEVWIYPRERRCTNPEIYDRQAVWPLDAAKLETPLPATALNILWRDELFALCGKLRVSVGRRATMLDMTRALRWHCTGRELTTGICATLRARRCAEADVEMAA